MAKLSRGLEFLISQLVIPGDTVPVILAHDVPPAPEVGACLPVGRVEGEVGSRVIQLGDVKVVVLPRRKRGGS